MVSVSTYFSLKKMSDVSIPFSFNTEEIYLGPMASEEYKDTITA
jgi:hypothetical protein